VAEPGLIVVLPQADPVNSLYALSPQDGSVLDSLDATEHRVTFAVFESGRQLWYLGLDDKIVAATFDRTTNEWSFDNEDGPDTGGILDLHQIYAFPKRLVILQSKGSSGGNHFVVFDTEDPADISRLDSIDTPPGVFWNVAPEQKSVGGDLHYLAKNCADVNDNECPVELTRIAISPAGLQTTKAKEVGVINNGIKPGARGNLSYDRGQRKLAVLIPNLIGSEGRGTVEVYTTDHEQDGTQHDFQIPDGNAQSFVTMTVDYCDSVAYSMIIDDVRLFGVPLTSTGTFVMNQGVDVQGYGIAYEPFTRSVLTTDSTSTGFGIDSWEIIGDADAPQVKLRLSGWTRPGVRPRFIAVEEQPNIACP
jgi:hypothetical protein